MQKLCSQHRKVLKMFSLKSWSTDFSGMLFLVLPGCFVFQPSAWHSNSFLQCSIRATGECMWCLRCAAAALLRLADSCRVRTLQSAARCPQEKHSPSLSLQTNSTDNSLQHLPSKQPTLHRICGTVYICVVQAK